MLASYSPAAPARARIPYRWRCARGSRRTSLRFLGLRRGRLQRTQALAVGDPQAAARDERRRRFPGDIDPIARALHAEQRILRALRTHDVEGRVDVDREIAPGRIEVRR